MSESSEEPRETIPLVRPKGGSAPTEPPRYAIHASSKGLLKPWRDLSTSHGNKLRYYYDYLSQTPLTQEGERVFPLQGPALLGTWECEVGGGARLFYVVDEELKKVIIRAVFTSHP